LGIVLGCLRATSGHYRWFGEEPTAALRTRIGALLEKPTFYPWLSASQNLQITAKIRRIEDGTQAVLRALAQVGLGRHGGDAYSTFSLGMKQRLGLASALLGDPEVLVLDEPTNGIDAEGIAHMRMLFLELAATGKTLILSSHILDEIEKVCSHVIILKAGHILAQGAIGTVLQPEDGIEVASSNMETLLAVLQACPHLQKVERHGDLCQVMPAVESFTVEALNRWLVEHHVFASHLAREGEELTYTVRGSGFLRHMVRNIVGTLLEVGKGRMAVEQVPEILEARRRSAGGPALPGKGLCLVSVEYDIEL
jgi:ABC-2 type transport system ATP-binding protein